MIPIVLWILLSVSGCLGSRCSVSKDTHIYCTGFDNFHSLNASIHTVISQSASAEDPFELKITNSTIDTIPEYGFGGYRFEKIHLEDIDLSGIHHRAFESSGQAIKYFVHRNQNPSIRCLRLRNPDPEYDLWKTIQVMRSLDVLELCLNNRGDSIPSGAFRENHRLMTIRFKGNYSRLVIEAGAFESMDRIRLIVFNKIYIHHFGVSHFEAEATEQQTRLTIIFNRCFFDQWRETFGETFQENSLREIEWYISPGM